MTTISANYVGDSSIAIRSTNPEMPRAGQVQIEVAFVGLCGTDLHVYKGDMDARVSRPAVLGHEMSGRISQIGEGVVGWSVGDPVTVMPLDWDGTCAACQRGNTHVCQNLNFIGIDTPGALQNTWNVPASTLVALPDGLRLDHAALAEPVAVSVHDVRRSRLVAGERAVVIGAGPIGVLIATAAREAGADVLVIEVEPNRRRVAEELGFPVLDPRVTDQVGWVEEWTNGAGADVVFEVSGAPTAVLGATGLARVRGRVVIVAIHPEPRPIDLHRIFWRELSMIGARVYQRHDFERAIELLDAGVIPAERLITRIDPLADAAQAFQALASGEAMKILVDCRRTPE